MTLRLWSNYDEAITSPNNTKIVYPYSIELVVTILPPNANAINLTKGDMRKPHILNTSNGPTGFSIVIDSNGLIEDVDTDLAMDEKYNESDFTTVIKAHGMSCIPGFVDAHTHPVWAGDRVHEFALKLGGASYLDIHKAGGGIHFTVDKTREASFDDLYQLFKERATEMLASGTTTIEAKSGYGLDTVNEIKMLKVLEKAKREGVLEISSTFCGAHAVPKGSTVDEATKDVIENQLPAIITLIKSGDLNVENIDVFCEKGVFNIEQTRNILEAGQAAGLAMNFHGDELYPTGSAELGASLTARAISHLEECSDTGISAMAVSGSVAVILPTTAYLLRLKAPPVRKMIDAGVVVALGSDFNPNAFCSSMPLVMNLACLVFGMSMEEAVVAATLNSAASIGRGSSHGAIQPGRVADLVLINTPNWEHIIYRLGHHHSLIQYVLKRGRIVYSKNEDAECGN